MPDALTLGGEYVELLPARTVMSMSPVYVTGDPGIPGQPGTAGDGGQATPGSGHTTSGTGTVDHVDTNSQGISGASGSATPGS